MKFIIVSCITLLSVIQTTAQNLSNDTFGKGLTTTAKDSSFQVKFGFRFQTLYIGSTHLASGTYADEMIVRRSRLKFEGFAYDPKITYKLELALSNRDQGGGHIDESGKTASIVLDAVAMWKFADGWQLWFGQTKLPGNRERVISSQRLQFVDRSLVNSRFNLDRDKGVQLHHESGSSFVFRQAFAVSMGEGRNIVVENPAEGHQITGRLEFLPFGKFTDKGDYFGSDLKREPKPKLSIGVSGDINYNAVRSRGNLGSFQVDDVTGEYVTNDLKTWMVDMMFKYNGWSLASEYANRHAAEELDSFGSGTGFVLQGGYLFPSNWEIAGRYTTIDGFDVSSISDETEYTLGVSRYIKGHNLKIQSDISRSVKPTGSDELIFRFQTELAF